MPEPVQFHGDRKAQDALLAALASNCECTYGEAGEIVNQCPGHKALVTDQSWVNHMEWARSRAAQWQAGEDMEESRDAEQ